MPECPLDSNSPYKDYELTDCGLNVCPEQTADERSDYLNTYGPTQLVFSEAIDDSALFRKVCDIFDLLEEGGIGPGPGGNNSVMFNASRKGNITALAVDLRREDRSNLNRTPFVILDDSEITRISMRLGNSTADWTLEILASTDDGVSYAPVFMKSYVASDTSDLETNLSINTAQSTLLRVRYTRDSAQGTFVRDLQVNFLTQFT